jgi:hypothetical protein
MHSEPILIKVLLFQSFVKIHESEALPLALIVFPRIRSDPVYANFIPNYRVKYQREKNSCCHKKETYV